MKEKSREREVIAKAMVRTEISRMKKRKAEDRLGWKEKWLK